MLEERETARNSKRGKDKLYRETNWVDIVKGILVVPFCQQEIIE